MIILPSIDLNGYSPKKTSARFLLFSAVSGIIALVSFGCAGQVYPTGGPPDTTPPKILSTVPAPGALRQTSTVFHLEFSEYVDKRSVEESVFLSPPLGKPEYDWDGTDVEIRFPDSLKHNTTYILTVGTDVRDTKEKGNRMEEAFALPFSTGDHIDSASIAGTVYDAEPEGVMIGAYKLEHHLPDSINPTTKIPDFLTQTGKDGTFRLPYLAFGTYRLVAFRDEYKNLLYDRQTDKYGVYTKDVRLTSDSISVQGVQFLLTKEDTSSPFLSSVRAVDRNHFLLKFSEAMKISDPGKHSIFITDTLTNQAVDVWDFSFIDTAGIEALVATSSQESSKVYRIAATNISDRFDNPINLLSNTGVSEGSNQPDTILPVMRSVIIGDSVQNIGISDPLLFTFSEAVRKVSFEHAFTLKDSQGTGYEGIFQWRYSTAVMFYPQKPISLQSWYTITIVMDSVIDMNGNGLRDSILVTHFRTVGEKDLSSISGNVVQDDASSRGKLHLTITDVSESKKGSREALLDSTGVFHFENLPEGRYAFFLYEDKDGNNAYSYGMPFPFTYSERFSFAADTLKLRARWPLEGVKLRLK